MVVHFVGETTAVGSRNIARWRLGVLGGDRKRDPLAPSGRRDISDNCTKELDDVNRSCYKNRRREAHLCDQHHPIQLTPEDSMASVRTIAWSFLFYLASMGQSYFLKDPRRYLRLDISIVFPRKYDVLVFILTNNYL